MEKEQKNGKIIAAVIACSIGLLILSITNLLTEIDDNIKNTVFDIGKIFIPYADIMGPYSGKAVILIASWLSSWIILHYTLRDKILDLDKYVILSIIVITIATLILWPPFIELLV